MTVPIGTPVTLAIVDMALAVLRHDRNTQIRRLAQEIIVTQQQEIAVMNFAVSRPLPPSSVWPLGALPPPLDRNDRSPLPPAPAAPEPESRFKVENLRSAVQPAPQRHLRRPGSS